jgi:hypothetical protein
MPLQRPEYQALWKEVTQKRLRVFNQTGDKTLKPSQTGSVVTNLGATGAVTVTLPSGRRQGDNFTFVVAAAQELRVDPGDDTDVIYINGAAQTAGKYITADDEAESVTVLFIGDGKWVALGATGTWTVEA